MKAQFRQWRQQPETDKFFNYLKKMRESTKENWAKRAFEGSDFQTMMLKNAEALGEVAILDDLLHLETFEDMETE